MSYLASLAVVIVGIAFGFLAESIDGVMKWIVAALFGGYTAANLLKWVWWRFNGYGYFWGMVGGLLASLVVPLVLPDVAPLNAFPIILAVATTGSLLGTFLTAPEEDEVLISFYTSVKPWGVWKPIHEKAMKANPEFQTNGSFKRDMINCTVGIIWQMCLVVIPIYLVIREYQPMWVAIAVFVVTSVFLKRNWLNKIED